MVVYAATIVLSAFLLFQVQPLLGKIVLPWFGGSAAVWSAVLMFFQVGLLAGYAYAHLLIARVRPKAQAVVHGVLLAASVALLPILPAESWKPAGDEDPTSRILGLLAVTVGLPYFLLSSTSPLLQAWYARRNPGRIPYRLFALSNAGSLAGLLSFPFLVEPWLTSRQQGYAWSGAYVAFAVLGAFCAWRSRTAVSVVAPVPPPIVGGSSGEVSPPRPRAGELILWLALAACASLLLVAVTQHVTQNVAPIPLIWVGMLTLYLVTFIVAFERERGYPRRVFLPMLPVVLAPMAYLLYAEGGNVSVKWTVPAFSVGLFVCCMVCHGELARRRPDARHLTVFYLMVSVGGAVGGLFVALVAPRVFDSYAELPVGLSLCAVLALILTWGGRDAARRVRRVVAVGAVLGFVIYAWRPIFSPGAGEIHSERNFYGVLRVVDDHRTSPPVRRLYHGSILHGAQIVDPASQRTPVTYYGETSGVGRAIRALEAARPRLRVGVLGLGAGGILAYGRPGDHYDVYEIDPAVEPVARGWFAFLEGSTSEVEVHLGDARLTLERQPDRRFDLLVMDAFSGDAVPVHLLTREALDLYRRHLRPDGVLAINVTNRYLDLTPVTAAAADETHVAFALFTPSDRVYLEPNHWVMVAQRDLFESAPFDGVDLVPVAEPTGFRPWTDDYSNVVGVLDLSPG